jgi:transposase
MEQWAEIRRRVLAEGVSKRQILRETGMHWETLEKILEYPEPPGYRLTEVRRCSKLDRRFRERIAKIIETDKQIPRKQRHTAKRIYERLREEGYTGRYTQVREAVRSIKQVSREVFVPLIHRPGEAQMDFGFAVIKVRGVMQQVVFAVYTLPYSGAQLLQVFPRICIEAWWEAHRRSFEFFGGVARLITYDNDLQLVRGFLGAHGRTLTHGFLQLKSFYLFDVHFCRVRRANEKGSVEGDVRYVRQNFLVPVPEVDSFDELNERLKEQCRADLANTVRGKQASKSILLSDDRAAFLPLPTAEFDACVKHSTMVNAQSLVRFDTNDYSVPSRCAHRPVVLKGYIDRVEVWHKGEMVALHTRLWCKEGVSFDPRHYLAVLERKPGALDHARPLENWKMPECFVALRARLEDLMGPAGKREYIGVLRLLEQHDQKDVERAVERAMAHGVIGKDAIAQCLLAGDEFTPPVFTLDGREHLAKVRVDTTDASAYEALRVGGGAQ